MHTAIPLVKGSWRESNAYVGKLSEQTIVRLSPEEMASLRDMAAKQGTRLAVLVRAFVERGLHGYASAPAASPVTIGEDIVLPVPCVAVNVSAGPGAPWTEYPSKGPRHYFYRRSFVRRAIGLARTDPDPDWSRFQTVILDRDSRLARSMMPTIQPGAMLLVDTGYDTGRLEPRTICFVNLAEKPGERLVAVKRVTVTDHVCVLESDNYTEPEFFPVIRHVGKNIRDLVLGVVLEWSTRARMDESNDPPA